MNLFSIILLGIIFILCIYIKIKKRVRGAMEIVVLALKVVSKIR